MRLGIELCFEKLALNGGFYINFFDKYVKFGPKRFVKNHYVKDWNENRHRKIIADCTNTDSLVISNQHDIYMTTDVRAVTKSYRTLVLSQDFELLNPANSDITELVSKDEFVAGYLYDNKYVRQQSAVTESDYEVSGISLDLAEGLPYTLDDYHGSKIFDISSNPGRTDMVNYTLLLACWKMWFGKGFYNIVPKERILSFPDAYELRELEGGIVYCQLFEKIEESSSPENQKKQWAWRKWLDFDRLVRESSGV